MLISPINKVNNNQIQPLQSFKQGDVSNFGVDKNLGLSGYQVGRAILARNNVSFRNLAVPIEVTDRYDKKIDGQDHLDLPNIHVYEYPDTNLQVFVNEVPNKTSKNEFQATFSLFNTDIKNDSVIKRNLLMGLINQSLNRNDINADVNDDFDAFINIDLSCNTSEVKKINLLNKIITKPEFTKQDLEECKKLLINTINSEKYQKETAEFKKLVDSLLLNSKEETIKNIQNIALNDIYSYHSEMLKNTEAQYTVTIDKSFVNDNQNLFYSILNSGISDKFQKHSDKIISALKPISNKEDIRINDENNETYLTFHYPVKVESNKERLVYKYLTLLEIFWRYPYVSEDSCEGKYLLPMELKDKNINPNKFGFLEFKFMPDGNEKINSTDNAIEVFKAVLEILYDEKLASNTLESIKEYEKTFYDEQLNKKFNSGIPHKILQNYRGDVFKIYETIDAITIEDIRETIEQTLFEQNPIVIVNERINPFRNQAQYIETSC